MTAKEMKLAAYFLRLAAESYSNHTCNDIDSEAILAANFTELEDRKFGVKVAESLGYTKYADRVEWANRGLAGLQDCEAMEFLAEMLEQHAEGL